MDERDRIIEGMRHPTACPFSFRFEEWIEWAAALERDGMTVAAEAVLRGALVLEDKL